MMENCQKSCNSCDNNDTGDATDDVYDNDDATECSDKNDRCAEWAADDQCESNPSWMLVNCQLSCNVCGDDEIDRDRPPDDSDCADLNESCRIVSDSGDCQQTKCAFWADEGECDKNPSYMLENCSKSCGRCETLLV